MREYWSFQYFFVNNSHFELRMDDDYISKMSAAQIQHDWQQEAQFNFDIEKQLTKDLSLSKNNKNKNDFEKIFESVMTPIYDDYRTRYSDDEHALASLNFIFYYYKLFYKSEILLPDPQFGPLFDNNNCESDWLEFFNKIKKHNVNEQLFTCFDPWDENESNGYKYASAKLFLQSNPVTFYDIGLKLIYKQYKTESNIINDFKQCFENYRYMVEQVSKCLCQQSLIDLNIIEKEFEKRLIKKSKTGKAASVSVSLLLKKKEKAMEIENCNGNTSEEDSDTDFCDSEKESSSDSDSDSDFDCDMNLMLNHERLKTEQEVVASFKRKEGVVKNKVRAELYSDRKQGTMDFLTISKYLVNIEDERIINTSDCGKVRFFRCHWQCRDKICNEKIVSFYTWEDGSKIRNNDKMKNAVFKYVGSKQHGQIGGWESIPNTKHIIKMIEEEHQKGNEQRNRI